MFGRTKPAHVCPDVREVVRVGRKSHMHCESETFHTNSQSFAQLSSKGAETTIWSESDSNLRGFRNQGAGYSRKEEARQGLDENVGSRN